MPGTGNHTIRTDIIQQRVKCEQHMSGKTQRVSKIGKTGRQKWGDGGCPPASRCWRPWLSLSSLFLLLLMLL